MLRRNTHPLGLTGAAAVLLAAVAFTACGTDGAGAEDGSGGAGGAGATGTGTGVGPGVTSGGDPASTGAVTPATTGTGTEASTGAVTPATTGVGGSTASGSNPACGNIDITPPGGNPFAGGKLFVDPEYVAKVQSSIDRVTDEALIAKMRKVQEIPTAFWLDRIAAVERLPGYLDKALELQNQLCEPVIPVIVVYDLPNRDCFAEASNGELRVETGGVERYRKEFIDPITEILAARPNLRTVAIIEPDSLPNLATNLGQKDCTPETEKAYRENVAYALQKLGALSHVYQYIDAAHSGWLGWTDNQEKAAQIFSEVISAAGSPKNIRGFATNVSNYTLLKYAEGEESYDQQFNPCYGELDYVTQFGQALSAVGLGDKHFIIDTSRNGRGGIRKDWGYWCNNIGAGMGERPRANPGGAPRLDAFYWVKPPGDSDGTADRSAERFDEFCGYENADPRAPEAGHWFHEYFVECVKNANPPL